MPTAPLRDLEIMEMLLQKGAAGKPHACIHGMPLVVELQKPLRHAGCCRLPKSNGLEAWEVVNRV